MLSLELVWAASRRDLDPPAAVPQPEEGPANPPGRCASSSEEVTLSVAEST